MLIIVSILLSYLIGSIPFAFFLLKLFAKSDITKQGSGNVGAMNSYEITGKKWLGILVFILDCAKGVLAVWLIILITHTDFRSIFASGLAVIIGHNYSIFLKFRGGRGLATAMGVSLATSPLIFIVWGVLWVFGFYIIKKDVYIGNLSATIMTPLCFLVLPDTFIGDTTFFYPPSIFAMRFFVSLICLIIFIRHIGPLRELLSKENDSEND